MIGTVVFSEKGNYIVGATEKQNEEFRTSCKKLDIDMDALRARDSVEIKGITQMEITSENYNNILKVKGMPGSVFGNSYGYTMQKEIAGYMQDYYSGKISVDQVKQYFSECCVSMRVYCSQERFTTGKDEEDNTQIVSEVYEVFAKENARAARGANYQEGLEICNRLEYSGRNDDWVYYNADDYYQCEDTKNILREAVADITEKWEIADIDCNTVEENSKLTLDGGFDFNSNWNWDYRNQVGRSSIENEMIAPPEDFKFFFKESYGDKGLLKAWAGMSEKTIEIPFYISKNSLKGQIFNSAELFEFSEADTDYYTQYNSFLKNISVFTRWYAQSSGINNREGNFVPDYN